MSNIIEHDGDEPNIVKVGADHGQDLSLKIYQDIYHQITGKTEEIRKRYKDAIKIEKSDVQQLHHKMVQLFDIHNVVASNSAFTIFYEKERKEQYTSFEQFEAFKSNGTSPVVSIVLQYFLSIIPAKLEKPQEYKVTIRLSSRTVQLKTLREDAPAYIQALAGMITSETAEIRIQYADYIVARGFLEAFSEWIDACTKTPESKIIKFCQRYSHFIPPIGKIVIAALYGAFVYTAIDKVFTVDSDLILLTKFLTLSGTIFVVAVFSSAPILRLIERSIDSFSYLSWIKINKGDENVIKKESSSQLKNGLIFIGSSMAVIALGVLSSQISEFIDKMT